MIAMSEIVAFDFPGRKLRFEIPAASAFDGLDLFCQNFISLFAADIALCYFDAELGYALAVPRPERPHWLLRSAGAPPTIRIRPAWQNEDGLEVGVIDGSSLRAAIEAVREASEVDWSEILLGAARVRLPWSADQLQQCFLPIRVVTDVIDYPIEREGGSLFVNGPLERSSVPAPIRLSMRKDMGVATMDIDVYWSLWTDSHQNGFEDLRKAAGRLRDADWRCTYSEIEGV
jgi:hypothetical protein